MLRFAFARSEGQALVEFALLSPLVLVLVLGMCVFGLMLNQYLILSNAVTIGAQQLATSRNGSSSTDACAIVYNAVTNAAPSLTAANLSFTIAVNGSNFVSGASGSSNVTCGSDASTYNADQNDPVSLTVTYPFTASFIGFTRKSYTMSATVEEVLE
ncbi:MAG: TadE/TadG family type IV pilus assembly protein [Acidobacteriaceae bacterium]